MKKILSLVFTILFSLLTPSLFVFAEWWASKEWWAAKEWWATKENKTVTVIVSEIIPWARCKCISKAEWAISKFSNKCGWPVAERKYECTTKKWLAWFLDLFARIVRYIINIVLLLWVLAIVVLWIVWSFSGWEDTEMKTKLKTWAQNVMIWMLILFLFRVILRFLAPWVFV